MHNMNLKLAINLLSNFNLCRLYLPQDALIWKHELREVRVLIIGSRHEDR